MGDILLLGNESKSHLVLERLMSTMARVISESLKLLKGQDPDGNRVVRDDEKLPIIKL